MLNTIPELIINLIEASMDYILISHCLQIRFKDWRRYLYLFTDFLIITVCNVFAPSVIVTLLILLTSEVLLTVLITSNPYRERFFWGCVPSAIYLISEKTVIFIGTSVIGINLDQIFDASPVRYGLVITYLLFSAAIIFVIIHLKNRALYFPRHILAMFFALIVAGILCTQMLEKTIIQAENAPAVSEQISVALLYTVGIVLILILITLFLMITYIGRIYKRNMELKETEAQHKLDTAQYEALSDSNQVLRTWKHEYINHLQTLSLLMEQEKFDDSRQYIEQLTDSLQANMADTYTGNSAVDAILSVKKAEAETADIAFSHETYLPENHLLPLNDVTLAALLGNMLNNAIDAAVATERPYIQLSIRPVKNSLMIVLKNSSAGCYLYNKKGELLSTKGKGHGLGLKRITAIAEEVGGFSEVDAAPDTFTVSVMLPLHMDERS